MKRVVLVLVAVACLGMVFCAYAQEQIRVKETKRLSHKHVPGEIIVKFKAAASARANSLIARHGASQLRVNRLGSRRLKIPAGRTVSEMVKLYKNNPDVEYAEPNYIAYAHWVPDDQFYSYQWHMDNAVYGGVGAEAAWDITAGDAGVVVAVVDTGVAYEDYTEGRWWRKKSFYLAPDLAQTNFVPGYDFVNNDSHPNDDEGHGTHVAGTIAQSTNNSIGTVGLAFNCSIMPVKVLDKSGSGSYADIADGIIWAADNGANVINMSLGGPSPATVLEEALEYAYNQGVTIVCSSGNDGEAVIGYPAAYDAYCIAVGATRYDETRSYYSNYGPGLDLVAPGGDTSIDQNGDGYVDGVLQQTFGSDHQDWGYWFYQGTSMAAPHASAAAALVISSGLATTPAEVREVLQTTAKDLGPTGFDPEYGWGRVDAFAALTYSPEPNDPPVADAGGPYEGSEDIEVVFDGSASYDPDDDPLSYSWDFGDGSQGSGVAPSHTYAAGGTYDVTLVVNDGRADSEPAVTTATIVEVNDPPVADAGSDQSGVIDEAITFDGSASYDPEGAIASYEWDFGDGTTGSGANVSHSYAVADTYTVTLTVTDAGDLSDQDTALVTISEPSAEIEVFNDSFEAGEWNGLWHEDTQNDWFRSSQRAASGSYSAEVDGRATDAELVSIPIGLQGRPNATVSFSWYIERGLDSGEYLAFDIATDGGSWVEQARLRGNVDPENTWHTVSLDVSGASTLQLRFRGRMSVSNEDANLDAVKVKAW